ncbi:MAG: hypothetical protein JWL64_852 [Frankiales bacterium]|nr:hypothetical protein [Frankiales bacterium]
MTLSQPHGPLTSRSRRAGRGHPLSASARTRRTLSPRRRLLVAIAVSGLWLAGLTAPFSSVASAADAAPVTGAKVDFTTATGAVATGYTRDSGQAYDPARGFGWVTPGTATPVDMTLNTRVRTAPTDQRLKTLTLMQGSGVSTQPHKGAWELNVVNGSYTVTVAVGDANFFDSVHRISSEGTLLIDNFVPSSGTPFKTATATVTVTDGRLTLDPTGGTNTKITYVDVVAVTAPPPPPPPGATRKIDFSDAATTPAAGYERDYGQPYGLRTTGATYGWVREGTTTPVDLTANGRNRATATSTTDQRLKSLIHMQFRPETTGGNPTPGAWELAVPNGAYVVTASVGDAGNYYDSVHQLSIENQNAVFQLVPTSARRFAAATRTVYVADGRLTLSAAGGTNTKLDYVDVTPVDASPDRPRVAQVAPVNLATVSPDSVSVTAELALTGSGVSNASVTSSTVKLSNAKTGAAIAATVNTSGGGDVLVLTPTTPLAATTSYRFDVTNGVRDTSGVAFQPWSSVFTTDAGGSSSGIAGVAFDKVATGVATESYTSVTVGPDHRLYAGSLGGNIYRFPINANGSLGTPTVIGTVPALHAGAARSVIGLTFDPAATSADPIMWVTDNAPYLGTNDVPDWQGQLVRLSGSDLQTGQVVLTGLPRSTRDHETNSIAFGPDGMLYVNQGSNSAMGAPDGAWGNRPERLLSASVLRLDRSLLPATLPLDVQTEAGGTYDPFAAGAPLTIYASGVRNAYDLVWHSNGRLYVPTNGSAANGNTPSTPATLPASCAKRLDSGSNGAYTGPPVTGLTPNTEAETDWVFKVTQGGYYGHPNPARCEWVMNGGNPTAGADPFQVGGYAVGTQPDRNYRAGDAYDVGLHASADGAIEYRNAIFGSKLQGKLIVVRYSAGQDLVVLDPSGPGGSIVSQVLRVTGFTGFTEPLDVTEDAGSGNLYVTELGASTITLLTPKVL